MIAKGKFKFKSIEEKDGGEFTNAQGQKIKYDSSYSIKVDEIDKLTEDKEMLEVFPNLASKLIKDKAGLDLIVNVTNDINAKTVKDNATFTKIFEPKKLFVTPLLIII